MAQATGITLENGCYVFFRSSFKKSWQGMAYVSALRVREADSEQVVTLVTEQGVQLQEETSVKNLWHVGSDHSKCKQHE